jgi:hypothetical protein
MTIKIKGYEHEIIERKAVKAECWYDRHRREWVLCPVDDEGNQLCEAQYAFSKAEAKRMKNDIEERIANGEQFSY